MAVEGIKSLSDPQSFANLKKYVEEFLNSNKYNEKNPMDGNYAIAYKNHVARVTEALNSTKGLNFIQLQSIFKAMNPGPVGTGKILNPITPYGPAPGAEGVMTDSLDIPMASLNPRSEQSQNLDSLLKEALRINEEYKNKNMNLYSEDAKATEYYYIDNQNPHFANPDGTSKEQIIPGVEISKPDYSKIFEQKARGFDFGNGEKGYKRFEPKIQSRKKKSTSTIAKQKNFENQDSFFHFAELEKGYITEDQFNEIGIEDKTNYMPFFLEDMRSNGKRIYFRAFFKNLRESIAPTWNQEQYFGRVDPVGIYVGTSRTISVSFAMIAFSPEGFTTLWRKLNQLSKLLYPTFQNGVMTKAPMARLRIGDVICDFAGNGLTGYISSPLELDYSDSVWEVNKWVGFDAQREVGKAPQMVTVSFTFQVIHESAPQIDQDFNFDTSFFRRIGGLQEGVVNDEESIGEDSVGEDGT